MIMKRPIKDTQKIHKEHNKLGKPKTLNKAQLEKLVKHFKVKYCFNLEEVIVAQQQEIHHLRKSNEVLHKRINSDGESLDFQRGQIKEHVELHKVLIDKYEDSIEELEKQLEEAHKIKNEAIKDYRALWDLKELADSPAFKHHPLPEDQKQKEFIEKNFNLEVKGQTLESGRLQFKAKMKPKSPLQKLTEEKAKKNGKDK